MMNVNGMKGILGDAVSNEVRTLELRVGQVVRGVVLQQFPNNEATVSINGVQVRAKLEVPIMEGQASLLQVQPDSKGGHVHLKQVDPAALGLQDPMKDILKALSLPDKPWANELIKDLRKEGFALNKETAAAFQRAAQLMPAGVNQEQWMNAAAAAFKRGLPMSEASIAAIHQLQSGAPAHQLLDQLRGQLTALLQSNSASASNTSASALMMQLVSLLDEGAELLRQISGQAPGSGQLQQGNAAANGQMTAQQSSTSMQAAATPAAQQQAQAALQANGASQTASAQQMNGQPFAAGQQQIAVEQSAVQPNQAATVHAQGNSADLLPKLLKWLGVNYEAVLGKQLMQQPTSAPAAQAGQAAQQQGMLAQPLLAPQSGVVSQSAQQAGLQGQQQTQPANNGVQGAQLAAQLSGNQTMPATVAATGQSAGAAQAMPQPGVEATLNSAAQQGAQPTAQQLTNAAHVPSTQAEQGVAALSQSGAQHTLNTASQLGTQQTFAAGQQQEPMQAQNASITSQQLMQQASHDNVKSAILQLLGQPDVPNQVKETAQQLLHAITGQQLMLSAERNHSMFSHITMFIPIKDAGNGQTASVHIQTRRDRRGELDSENCRIVFDLQMKALGPTLVDMSIVNKIVSLNLWNDHPAVAPIVESLKPEISEALYNHGYMLSSVRATPIPIKEEEAVKQEEGKMVIIPPDIDQLSSTRYKGVDFKV